jgi:hypothetical protein
MFLSLVTFQEKGVVKLKLSNILRNENLWLMIVFIVLHIIILILFWNNVDILFLILSMIIAVSLLTLF